MQVYLLYNQPIDPLVCPLHTSSLIPQRHRSSGPGEHRPPGQSLALTARRTGGGRRRLEGCVPRGRGFWLRPGDVHFSQDHCHPPYPASRSPAMVRTGRKGFIPTNPKIIQPIRPFVLPARHPPSPNTLRTPGQVDVVYQDRGDPGLPAGQWAAAAGWRDASLVTGVVMWYVCFTCSLESLCERRTGLDFTQGQEEIFQVKLFCISLRAGLQSEAKYSTT